MLKKAYKRFLLFSVVFVVCGIMLTSVDDCEEGYEGYYEEYALADSGQNISQSQGTQGSGQSGTTAKSQTTGGTGTAATGSGQTAAQPAKTQPASTGSQSGQSGAAQPAKTQQPASTQTASSSGSQPAKTQPASTGSQSGQSGAAPAKTQQPASTASSSGSQPASTGSQASQSGQSGAAPVALSSISGKNWKLVEVRKDSRVIEINRQKLETDGFGDLFTIVFGDRISGRAAPNRFTAPYQAGANNALTIQQPASTMMAAIYDPERIHEKDYFQYLTGVKSWKLNQNRLELYSSDAGKETVLVYGN